MPSSRTPRRPAAGTRRRAMTKAKAKTTAQADPPSRFASASFDARPDRLDFRDLRFAAPLRSLPACHPSAEDLQRFLPDYTGAGLVLDQGLEGACTGFGLASVVNYLLWVRHLEGGGGALAFQPVSPRMLYELARRYDEWPGEAYDGSSCRGALKGWHKHGVCAELLWPHRSKTGKLRKLAPQEGWAEDAVMRPLGVYYRVDQRSVVDLQAAILQIGAVYVSARVHDGWDRVPSQPQAPSSHDQLPVIPPPENPGATGGHAFALMGYNARGFIVQNSWGARWGAGGFAVLPYGDWAIHAVDAWACALGVAQNEARLQHRIEALQWPSRSGRSLGFFCPGSCNPHNPPDDPWPIDRPFNHRPYEPWTTPQAYRHSLVIGNEGRVQITDVAAGIGGDAAAFVNRLVAELPLADLMAQARPRLMIYAHGGLNGEDEAIDRARMLGPLFQANAITPLFIAWRTGPVQTLLNIIEDKARSVFGISDRADPRAAGLFDGMFDGLSDARDRQVEALARKVAKGLWVEMLENARLGARPGRSLALLAAALQGLRGRLVAAGKPGLDIHLVGHSAGAVLLGHLLGLMASPAGGQPPLAVAGCTLYAPACSLQFAVQKYLDAAAPILSPQQLHLHVLQDREEKDDYLLGSRSLHLYGKSLLYLVSRALEDQRKMALLGLERALVPEFASSTEHWHPSQLPWLQAWQQRWGTAADPRVHRVPTPSLVVNRQGATVQARHGAFDNSVQVIGDTIARIRGQAPVAELEWLDY